MDVSQLIEQFGVPGLIIAGLVWDRLRMMAVHRTDLAAATDRLDRLIDGRIEDQKTHADQMMEFARSLDKAREAVERRAHV